MTAVWVLPSIDISYRRQCVQTMHRSVRDRLVVVDNCRINSGVAASWNLGVDAAEAEGADWLVLLSESVRLGPSGGRDFEDQLGDDDWVDSRLGWHMVAFSRTTLRQTGRFDENFHPAYLEDSDYLVRLHLAGFASPRINRMSHKWVETDAHDMGTEHSLRLGLVQVNFAPLVSYFESKWGAPHPGYAYERPFDDPTRDWTWWPEPRHVAA